jgi:hypothetical protein
MKRIKLNVLSLLVFLNIIVMFWIRLSSDKNANPIKQITERNIERRKIFEILIQRQKYPINCERLFEWDRYERYKSEDMLRRISSNKQNLNNKDIYSVDLLKTENFIFNKSMCELFREIRGYDSHRIDESELEIPIAFSILNYDNVEQFERHLRTIYRKHNAYCIHVDSKSDPKHIKAIQSIVQCFSNVFIATKLEKVYWGHFSRVQADINCMSDLIRPNSNFYKRNNFHFNIFIILFF